VDTLYPLQRTLLANEANLPVAASDIKIVYFMLWRGRLPGGSSGCSPDEDLARRAHGEGCLSVFDIVM
jgi:hypothetical protein